MLSDNLPRMSYKTRMRAAIGFVFEICGTVVTAPLCS